MFKLLIECTKDIESLSINFADGTSVVKEKSKPPESPESPESKKKPKVKDSTESFNKAKGELLDTDVDFNSMKSEVIKKPEIHDKIRDAKVANEIQNLEF